MDLGAASLHGFCRLSTVLTMTSWDAGKVQGPGALSKDPNPTAKGAQFDLPEEECHPNDLVTGSPLNTEN